MTALPSKICLIWCRAVDELRLENYDSKHATWSLSDMPFCAYFHVYFENCMTCKDVPPMEQLFYYWRCLFPQLELYAS